MKNKLSQFITYQVLEVVTDCYHFLVGPNPDPINNRVVETIKEVVAGRLDRGTYSLILFGSRAKGKHRPDSDYDVGIISQDPIGDDRMMDIRNALSMTLSAHCHIVEFNALPELVRSQILRSKHSKL